MLELHVDDTGIEVAEDMLQELAFYVPPGNEKFPACGEDIPASKVRKCGGENPTSDGRVAKWDGHT